MLLLPSVLLESALPPVAVLADVNRGLGDPLAVLLLARRIVKERLIAVGSIEQGVVFTDNRIYPNHNIVEVLIHLSSACCLPVYKGICYGE